MGMGWKPTVDHGGPHWTTLDHGGALWTTLDHGGAEAYSGITLDHSLEQQKPHLAKLATSRRLWWAGFLAEVPLVARLFRSRTR